MSNKNLLNENTVRRFMKLAEIEPLTDQFVGKLNESEDLDEQRPPKKQDDKTLEEQRPKPDGKDGKLDEQRPKPKADKLDEEEGHGDKDGKLDEKEGHGDKDGKLDEELEALLAEMEKGHGGGMLDDEEEDDLDLEPEMEADVDMDAAPGMGGLDMEALGDMIEDAVMNALEKLVDAGKVSVDEDEPEEVDLDEELDDDVDKMGGSSYMEEDVINEVARRVMKRIISSRR